MTRSTIACVPAIVCAAVLTLAAAPQDVNPQAEVLSRFKERVDAYIQVREKAASTVAVIEETMSPEEITARQQALGRAVKAQRAGARQGDIIFPEVATLLRQAIRNDLRRRPASERSAALAAIPDAPVLGVNDSYPSTVPLGTVPPRLLAQLPRLPEKLEYRFLGSRLILRDVDANIVVDYMDGALPKGRG